MKLETRTLQRSREIWKRSIACAKQLYTETADGFKTFEMGDLGANATLAVSLLYDYQMTGCKESLEKGFAVLDAWITLARSKEGHLLTRYGSKDDVIDAYNLGIAGCQLVEAYELAKLLGYNKPEYWQVALDICDFAIRRQREGGMGISWNPDGSPRELVGIAGSFLILALAEVAIRTKLKKYHVAAVRAYSYYYREFQKKGCGTSDALNASCIDKQSVVPLLTGGVRMYEESGFEKYLDMAQDVANYLAAGQAPQQVETSAINYVNALDKLAEYTGNNEWKQRALKIWRSGIQNIAEDDKPENIPTVQACALWLETLRKTENWNWLDGLMENGGNNL